MTTIVYSGGGISGDWADPKNWTGDKVPGLSDGVRIIDGNSMTVSAPVTVNSIMIIKGGTDTFTGSVTTGGVGSCQGFMVCVGSTVVFAPGSSLNDGGSAHPASFDGGGVLVVGFGGVGDFIAKGTSALPTTINSNVGVLGKLAAGVGTATIDDAIWTTHQYLTVGAAGTGTLDVESGGRVNVGTNLSVGADAGASGTINLGSGCEINVGKSLYLGDKTGAAGKVTLAAGASLKVGADVVVGRAGAALPHGVGSLTIEARSDLAAQGSLTVSSGSTVDLAGGTVSAALKTGQIALKDGGEINGHGTVATRAGGSIVDDGKITANGGTLQLDGTVSGTGSVIIDADSTVAINGASLLTPTLTFMSGTDETLSLSSPTDIHSIIGGFGVGDQIEVAGIDSAVWSSSADTLTLSDAGKIVGKLHFSGNYSKDVFAFTHAGGSAVITLHAALPSTV